MTLEPLAVLLSLASALSGGGSAPPPARPALRVVGDGIEVSWQRAAGAETISGWEVVRGNLLTGPFETVCREPPGALSCVDRSAKPEHIYFYKVRALGPEGPLALSPEATAEMPGPPKPKPGKQNGPKRVPQYP